MSADSSPVANLFSYSEASDRFSSLDRRIPRDAAIDLIEFRHYLQRMRQAQEVLHLLPRVRDLRREANSIQLEERVQIALTTLPKNNHTLAYSREDHSIRALLRAGSYLVRGLLGLHQDAVIEGRSNHPVASGTKRMHVPANVPPLPVFLDRIDGHDKS